MHLVLISFLFISYYLLGGDKGIYNSAIRKRQVLIMGASLFLFAALRAYTVGFDVNNYYYHMYTSGGGNTMREWWESNTYRDPGFYLMIGLLQQISTNPQIMLAVVGASVAFGFSYFVYYEKGNVLLFFMMFIGFRLFPFTLSGLRQAMAMSMIFIAYIKLKENKIILFFLLTMLAASFHASALVFLLAFPVTRYKNTFVILIVVLGISIVNTLTDGRIAATFASVFFIDRFSGYIIRSQDMVFEGSFTLYIYLVIYFVSLLFYRQLMRIDQNAYMDFNVLTLGVFFAVLGQSMDNVFRIAYYFIYPMYPIFSNVLFSLLRNRQATTLVSFIVSLLLALQYIYLGPGAGTAPYRFFWEI